MAKKFPLHPKHPERICWGCDRYCAADAMACGNGSDRSMHPAELLGDDWYTVGNWGLEVKPTRHRAMRTARRWSDRLGPAFRTRGPRKLTIAACALRGRQEQRKDKDRSQNKRPSINDQRPSHLSFQDLARPAGFEPTTPGS